MPSLPAKASWHCRYLGKPSRPQASEPRLCGAYNASVSDEQRAAALLAVAVGLLAAAEVVWVFGFLEQSSDGPAFAMALVVIVLVPTLLVGIGAVLVTAVPSRTRAVATAAVAASGLAVAGFEAGVFVGDDPTDPAFIHWAAAAPPFALLAAAMLIGFAAWGLLRPLPMVARTLLTAVTAIVTPVLLALGLLTVFQLLLLVALLTPVVLFTVSIVIARRQRRPAAN